MRRLSVLGKMMIMLLLISGMVAGPARAGIKTEIDEQTKGEVGIWMQTWFQHVEEGKGDEDLNDFILRRAYLYLKGQVTDYVGFFAHVASDKIGQDGLSKPSLGLGSGVAWRDLWIELNLHEAFKIKMGRMYVPLTRNYGTTSTKAMLTMDLPFLQGGSRGGIFYAQKVGRDDSLTVWGNPLDGRFQYRLMVGEGVEGSSISDTGVVVSDNPDDKLRFVGRVAVSLLDPETGWFNKGTYLGKKRVLSVGFGVDSQDDLTLSGLEGEDNLVWTVDAFLDHPVGEGAFTAEAAYINIDNCTQTQPPFTALTAGDDATNFYINAGYLLPGSIGPGRLQPYVRYETVDVDKRDVNENFQTNFLSGGLNYYIKGHNCKLTADYMHIGQDSDYSRDDQNIFTFQITVGF